MAAENVFTFLFFLGISIFCWAMLGSSSTRRKFGTPTYNFWRLRTQDRAGWDAMMLAAYLVGGLFFSLLTILFVVVGLYRLATR